MKTMKMKIWLMPLAAVLALTQVGCAAKITREQSGSVLGAVVGGVVGDQFGGGRGNDIATVVGVMAGAMIGSDMGKQLDKVDEMNAQRVLETTPTNQTSTWQNPDTGHQVAFVPTRTYQETSGRYCREYQSTVTVGGEVQRGYGTACRQPDGSWEMVN